MPTYGRTHDVWCRAIHCFIWLPHFDSFTKKIREKLEEKTGLIFNLFRIFGFINRTPVIATCRPGGGLIKAGPTGPNVSMLHCFHISNTKYI